MFASNFIKQHFKVEDYDLVRPLLEVLVAAQEPLTEDRASGTGLELNLGVDLQKPSTRRIGDRLINYVASTVKWSVPDSTKFKIFGIIHCHGCGSFRD